MSVEVKMPALSPTMEKGSIAKWLIKIGDEIRAGKLIAEIETDKATMELESVDEGVVVDILVAEGTEDVPVGTPIAIIGEVGAMIAAPSLEVEAQAEGAPAAVVENSAPVPTVLTSPVYASVSVAGDRIKVTPLARRLAAARGVDLTTLIGSGPGGRVVVADLGLASPVGSASPTNGISSVEFDFHHQSDIPHEVVKLSSMRKTIAHRLTMSKQHVPHIYLTVDVRVNALLALRSQINETLGARGIKVSINDMLVKALALTLIEVPACNVAFAGDVLLQYRRADISVAVSIPNGLITPVVKGGEAKSLSAIATEIKSLAIRAREGKLQPHEYQGGTASISNMGMFGIKQFDAVINPPQAMIMAIGACERRPVINDDEVSIERVMSVTGSFDHRAIDGADGATFMNAFRRLIENPMGIIV